MPDPKKQTNAPKNAGTDTGTGGGKNLAKKMARQKVKKALSEGAAEATAMTKEKTARPAARVTTQTNDGKGVSKRGSGEWTSNPAIGRASIPVTRRGPVDDQGVFGVTYGKDFYDEDHQDRVEGRENVFKSLLASGGKAGTVGKYSSDGGRGDIGKRSYDGTRNRSTARANTNDPFLRGFLSDDGATVARPTKRKK